MYVSFSLDMWCFKYMFLSASKLEKNCLTHAQDGGRVTNIGTQNKCFRKNHFTVVY